MTEEVEIVVGIYEGYVVGYRIKIDRVEGQLPNVQISRSFAGEFHTRSVRSLTTNGKLLASGGADDRIRVYDLEMRAEIKELYNHVGFVNAVVFVDDGKYLMSGGEDGRICFTNTLTWTVEKEWKNAHKGQVRCIAIHPDGALALTIGTDMILKSWNLINGRNVYSTSLKNKPQYGGIVELVRWSPNGEHFAVAGAKCVEVYRIETGNVIRSHKVDHRTTDLRWIGEADLLLGMENGEMLFFNIETEEKNVIPAHDARLKAMFYVEGLLATISSAGELCLWSINNDYTEIVQLRAYNLEFRPICMCIVESSKLGLTFSEEPVDLDETKEDVKDDELVTKGVVEDRVIIEYENDETKQKRRRTDTSSEESSSSEEDAPEAFKGQRQREVLIENEKKEPQGRKQKRNFQRGKKVQQKKQQRAKAMAFEETDVSNEQTTNHNEIKYTKKRKGITG